MQENKKYDVIVIGGGIAGMSAAIHAARLGKVVALVEKDELGGNANSLQSISIMPYYESLTSAKFVSQLADKLTGVDVFKDEVVLVDYRYGMFRVMTNNMTLFGLSVIFATGYASTKQALPDKVYNSTADIITMARNKSAFVCGDSPYMVAAANDLVRRCKAVYTCSESFERPIALSADVKWFPNCKPLNFKDNGNNIEVELSSGSSIECSVIVTNRDVKPNTKIAELLTKVEDSLIVTNSTETTKVPGVFAVGACRKDFMISQASPTAVLAITDGIIAAEKAVEFLHKVTK